MPQAQLTLPKAQNMGPAVEEQEKMLHQAHQPETQKDRTRLRPEIEEQVNVSLWVHLRIPGDHARTEIVEQENMELGIGSVMAKVEQEAGIDAGAAVATSL